MNTILGEPNKLYNQPTHELQYLISTGFLRASQLKKLSSSKYLDKQSRLLLLCQEVGSIYDTYQSMIEIKV